MPNNYDYREAGKIFYNVFATLMVVCAIVMVGYSVNSIVSMWGINDISFRLLIKVVLFIFFSIIFVKAIINDYKEED